MARAITHCGTLWTLRRDGRTARAEIVDIEGVGLELRYTRNDKRSCGLSSLTERSC